MNEDTRGWEKSSDPFMRKAAYYADMARRLQAKLDAVKNCKRYRIFNSVLYEPDPDGRLMLAKDVIEAIGEQE